MKNKVNKRELAEILGLEETELENNSKRLNEIQSTYYWNPKRGGLSVIICDDGGKLVATSAVSFSEHYKDFCDGKRN